MSYVRTQHSDPILTLDSFMGDFSSNWSCPTYTDNTSILTVRSEHEGAAQACPEPTWCWPSSGTLPAEPANPIDPYSYENRPLSLQERSVVEEICSDGYSAAVSAVVPPVAMESNLQGRNSVALQPYELLEQSTRVEEREDDCADTDQWATVRPSGIEQTPQNAISPADGIGFTSLQCWQHGCRGRSFSSYSNYRRHVKEKEAIVEKAVCSRCGQQFVRKSVRNIHYTQRRCKMIQFDANGIPVRVRI